MSYILKAMDRSGPFRYVADPGAAKSYTNMENARRFPTEAAAEAEACGNEVVTWISK